MGSAEVTVYELMRNGELIGAAAFYISNTEMDAYTAMAKGDPPVWEQDNYRAASAIYFDEGYSLGEEVLPAGIPEPPAIETILSDLTLDPEPMLDE
jgi:hypothetical protein